MDARKSVIVVGGGPAGMMAGLLLARAGVKTRVLEKHGDFLRDFRGDTVHPSTLRLFHELGLLEALLQRPHDKVPDISASIGGKLYEVGDFSRLDKRWNFIAMMPQWEFLDFVADEARRYPDFDIDMNAQATDLIIENGRVCGVICNGEPLRADLVVAADGRSSILREKAGFKVENLGASMDVFWFRIPKQRTPGNDTTGIFAPGRLIVLIDRGDYWQCAYVFAKGRADAVRQRGLYAFRNDVAATASQIASAISSISTWDDVKLLSVTLDRIDRWDRPGLLVIGDAAHAMSPIGGVGINVAIQDAVAAANILASSLAAGRDVDPLLRNVERERRFAVRAIQAFQRTAQRFIIDPTLDAAPAASFTAPLFVRLLDRIPLLRTLPAYFLGYGPRAEHIHSPDAGRRIA